MELEKLNKQLKEEAVCARCEALNEMGANMGLGKAQGDGLPREPEKYTLQGHRGKITKLVLHPFYNIVASASEDATIRLWDYDSGEQERALKSHTGIVNFLAFNPNGKQLASCSTDLSIKLWNLETYSVQKTLTGHEHEVSAVAYLANGD